MPGENIYDWSITAADNGTSDTSINFAEGQTRASVNNSARSMMAAHAKNRNLQNGSIVTGGSADAQTVTSGMSFTSVPTGMRILVKLGFTNTAAATLDLDSIGAVAIKTQTGVDVIAGALTANRYAEFIYNGTNWILISTSPITNVLISVLTQVFTASGTYTPATGMQYCVIECVGGGGGGGGTAGGGAGTYVSGGGGGSGGYSRKHASAATIGASQAVTIGVAAAGGGSPGTGGTGGTTSVGSLCIALGGTGGAGNSFASGVPAPGTGGAAGTGDFVAAGAPGGAGEYMVHSGNSFTTSGHGGSSYFGGGASSAISSGGDTLGNAASNYGSGGSGAASAQSGSGAGGGGGSAGVVMITEYTAILTAQS